jgi:hypothetical protein
MKDPIKLVFHRPEPMEFVSADKWKFTPAKRWAWLHRAAWWFLSKTNGISNAIDSKTTYKEVVINRKRITDRIMQAIDELHIANIRPAEVFMGPEEFDEAMHEMRDSYSFSVQMGFNRELFGLLITIIPWMRGIVIVPERRR